MSILSVDNISPIGSGTSVTINSVATLEVNKLNASGISTFNNIVDVTGSNSTYATVRLGSGANRRLMYRGGENDVLLEAANNFFYRQKISDTSHRWYTNGADEKVTITSAGDINIGSTTAASTTDPLTVDLGGQFTANASITNANLKLKLYHNGSNGDSQGLTASASGLAYVSSHTTSHIFYTTPSSINSCVEVLRIASDGDVGIGTNSPVERLHVHKASATGPFMYITNTSTGVSASDGIQIGYDGTNTAVFKNNEPTDLVFYAGSQNFRITSSGHVLPATNNTQDLGSTAKGWRNVYMNDLNLSNMNGDTNDVDGTQGSWTIQEGKDDLYIINRLNGKKFKIKMEEIS